jgi:hypothetical protein
MDNLSEDAAPAHYGSVKEAITAITARSKQRGATITSWLSLFPSVNWGEVTTIPRTHTSKHNLYAEDVVIDGVYTGATFNSTRGEVAKGSKVTFRFRWGPEGGTGQLKVNGGRWDSIASYHTMNGDQPLVKHRTQRVG